MQRRLVRLDEVARSRHSARRPRRPHRAAPRWHRNRRRESRRARSRGVASVESAASKPSSHRRVAEEMRSARPARRRVSTGGLRGKRAIAMGRENGSAGSAPAATSEGGISVLDRRARRSRRNRACGRPARRRWSKARRGVGFSPTMLLSPAGTRPEPAVSVPSANGDDAARHRHRRAGATSRPARARDRWRSAAPDRACARRQARSRTGRDWSCRRRARRPRGAARRRSRPRSGI